MFKLFLVASAICASAFAVGRTFRQCPDGTPLPSVVVTGCGPTDMVCQWTNGTNGHVELAWTTTSDITTLQAHLIATVNGVDGDYPIDSDGCATTTPPCPIAAGTAVTYVLDTPVVSTDIEVPITLTLMLHDQTGAILVCVQMDALVHA